MLDGGADPLYVGRRLVRMAVEDIGLADPRALRLSLDACETYERLGSPEGELALAQAAIYLACAAKSNAAYVAYNEARSLVQSDKSRPVPEHLRNAPTKLMKELGYGRSYRYAHDEADAYAAGENYFPEGLEALASTARRRADWKTRLPRSSRSCANWTEGKERRLATEVTERRATTDGIERNEKSLSIDYSLAVYVDALPFFIAFGFLCHLCVPLKGVL